MEREGAGCAEGRWDLFLSNTFSTKLPRWSPKLTADPGLQALMEDQEGRSRPHPGVKMFQRAGASSTGGSMVTQRHYLKVASRGGGAQGWGDRTPPDKLVCQVLPIHLLDPTS